MMEVLNNRYDVATCWRGGALPSRHCWRFRLIFSEEQLYGIPREFNINISKQNHCFCPVSNRGPFACETNVITTTLQKLMNGLKLTYFQNLATHQAKTHKWAHANQAVHCWPGDPEEDAVPQGPDDGLEEFTKQQSHTNEPPVRRSRKRRYLRSRGKPGDVHQEDSGTHEHPSTSC